MSHSNNIDEIGVIEWLLARASKKAHDYTRVSTRRIVKHKPSTPESMVNLQLSYEA